MGKRAGMPGPDTGKPRVPKEVQSTIEETGRAVEVLLKEPITLGPAQPDPEQIFLLFAAFGGDIFRCAHACGLPPEDITQYAEQGKWLERIRALIELKKGEKGPDVERGISRAVNFVQANKYRLIIERIIRGLDRMETNELIEHFVSRKVDSAGQAVITGFNLRPLADIASAMEKTHWMTYQALLDAPQDRAGRREKVKDDGAAEDDIHAKIARTLAGMVEHSPAKQIEAAHETQVADLVQDLHKDKPQV